MTNAYRGLWFSLAVLAGCSDDEGAILLDVDNISVSTAEDTPIAGRVPIQANRSVSGRIVTQPAHGTLTTGTDGFFEYMPAANYSGPDLIALEFFAAGKTATGTVTITVTPVDDAPTPVGDSFAAGFATSIDIASSTLLANDTDIDSPTLTVASVLAGSNGTVTMGSSGVTFRPASGFQGVATFTYRVSDGTSTADANVTVSVGTNQAPVAVNDAATTNEDVAVTIPAATLLANDTDADLNTLSISNVSNGTNGTVSIAGTVVTFTPTPNFNGVATFDYVASDGAGGDSGTVTIQVQPIADAPVAAADVATTPEDQVLTIPAATLTANDTDADGGVLQVSAVSNATNGAVALAGGSIAFTPSTNFSGVAGFDYTVSDGTLTAVGHVTITVTPLNDAPIAVTDLVAGSEDVPVILTAATLLANDTDAEGDALTLVAVGNPTNGAVSFVAAGIQFNAPSNYNGPASFEYTISDGIQTSVGTVSLTIAPVNDAPQAITDVTTTNEDTSIVLSPLANDLDVEGDALSVVGVGAPGHGTATVVGNAVTYTPAANYFGPDSFTYTAGDAGGANGSGTISITVVPQPDPPTAVTDVVSVTEDTPTQLAVLANDYDVDGETVSLVSAGSAAHGTTTVVGDRVLYAPATNYVGPDTFTYVISDPGGSLATGTVSITVTPVNDAPVAFADFYDSNDEVTLTVPVASGLLANDVDDSPMTVQLVVDAGYGVLVLNQDGSFTYTPDACAWEDTFTYVATDATLSSAETTVTISINHAPWGETDYYSISQGSILDVPATCVNLSGVLCNDTDVDLDPMTATVATPPANAQAFVLQPDGSFVYAPTAMFVGNDSFTYTVSDGVLTHLVDVDINVFGGCGSQCSLPGISGAAAQANVALADTEAEAPQGPSAGFIGPKCCLYSYKGPPMIDYCFNKNF